MSLSRELVGTARPSHPLPFAAFPCNNIEIMCVKRHTQKRAMDQEVQKWRGQDAPRLKGWVQLPEVRGTSSIFGSVSCSSSSLVSQFTCEVLRRVLKETAKGSRSISNC